MAGKEPRVLRSSSTSGPSTQKCSNSNCLGLKGELLKCYDCDSEFHGDCLGISETTCKNIFESAVAGARWHCLPCLTNPTSRPLSSLQANFESFKHLIDSKLSEFSNNLNRMNVDVNERLTTIETQNKNFPNEVKQSINTYAHVVNKNILENNETKQAVSVVSETIKNLESNMNINMEKERETLTVINEGLETVRSTIKKSAETDNEALARERKKNNICVYNIPENFDPSKPELSYKQDVKIIKEIFNEIDLKKDDVKSLYRAGRRDSTTTRPIIIKFASAETKFKVLELRDLKYEDNNIIISHDRTINERKERKILVTEMKRRKAQGEQNLFIKNGKIVKEVPFRANPQQYWG